MATLVSLLSYRFLLFTLLMSSIYGILALYLLNARFLFATFFSPSPVMYKITIILLLLKGSFTLLSPLDLFMLGLTALLVGINLALVTRFFRSLHRNRAAFATVGGSSIIGLLMAGCASCGAPILSLVSPAVASTLLPFQGMPFRLLVLFILCITTWYSFKTVIRVCRITDRTTGKPY